MPDKTWLSPTISIVEVAISFQFLDLFTPFRVLLCYKISLNGSIQIIDHLHFIILGEMLHCFSVLVEVLMSFFLNHFTFSIHYCPYHENFGIFIAALKAHCVLNDFDLVEPIKSLLSHVHWNLAIRKETL